MFVFAISRNGMQKIRNNDITQKIRANIRPDGIGIVRVDRLLLFSRHGFPKRVNYTKYLLTQISLCFRFCLRFLIVYHLNRKKRTLRFWMKPHVLSHCIGFATCGISMPLIARYASGCRLVNVTRVLNTGLHCILSQHREDVHKSRGDTPKITTLRQSFKKHNYLMRRERLSYHLRRSLPYLNRDIFSIIIDAAEQAGFNLPHFSQQTHSSQRSKIRVKIIGAIAHGQGCPTSVTV
jgi:hypothetical protein